MIEVELGLSFMRLRVDSGERKKETKRERERDVESEKVEKTKPNISLFSSLLR